jgi:hypothetical protein
MDERLDVGCGSNRLLGDVIFKCAAIAQSYGVATSMISRL